MTFNRPLSTRFAADTRVLRATVPLAEDEMRAAAPSIFAEGKHASRSERYTYIPTIDVLRGLRREGFEPFMVAQGKSRIPGKADFTKHMIRLRHAGGEGAPTEASVSARGDSNEIILINSHDGASSYQMLAGVFRFVCCNGLVVGDIPNDIRIPHKGDIRHEVIEGAFRVLEDFEAVDASKAGMKALTLDAGEERAFATAALALRYGERGDGQPPAPITAEQLTEARRAEDVGSSLWSTFQRVQENAMRGGQTGRSVQGRRLRSRPVASIDRGVGLNRALWVLAEEMRAAESLKRGRPRAGRLPRGRIVERMAQRGQRWTGRGAAPHGIDARAAAALGRSTPLPPRHPRWLAIACESIAGIRSTWAELYPSLVRNPVDNRWGRAASHCPALEKWRLPANRAARAPPRPVRN